MNLDDRRFLRELGIRLRDARRLRKMTQAQLGHLCDLDRTFIGSVERGERNLSILNLRRIVRALRADLARLIAERN